MKEALIEAEDAVVTNGQAAEGLQPGKRALDFPSSAIAQKFAAVLAPPTCAIAAMRYQQLDTTLVKSIAQGIGVVSFVGDDPLGFLSRSSSAPTGNSHPRERRLGERDLCRRSARELRSQRYALAIDQYHPLCPLPTLGFSHSSAPFLAATKLPSRKVSSHCNSSCWLRAANSCCQASIQISSSSHCLSRRQQVVPLGYSAGRSRHRAPVFSTHRMPSTQSRLEAGGRPRPSPRRLGLGKKCLISSHLRLLSLIPTAMLNATLTCKYLFLGRIYF